MEKQYKVVPSTERRPTSAIDKSLPLASTHHIKFEHNRVFLICSFLLYIYEQNCEYRTLNSRQICIKMIREKSAQVMGALSMPSRHLKCNPILDMIINNFAKWTTSPLPHPPIHVKVAILNKLWWQMFMWTNLQTWVSEKKGKKKVLLHTTFVIKEPGVYFDGQQSKAVGKNFILNNRRVVCNVYLLYRHCWHLQI